MKQPVVVIGAGGHAKVIVEALQLMSVDIVGILDTDIAKTGTDLLNVPILGNDDYLELLSPEAVQLVNGLGSISSMQLRREIYSLYKGRGFRFSSVIHPASVISQYVSIGEGVQVLAGAVINPGASIGDNSIINTRASVDHDCIIGSHVHVAPGAVLSGSVHIDDNSHIGVGACVIQGVRIGRNCVVGAGSVVLKNIADGETVAGIPARVIGLEVSK